MEKIKTIFERNWETNRKVADQLAVDFDFANAVATEKLDGMNIRITMRNGHVVRIEKRRNPSKEQKAMGIVDPWYVDTHPENAEDKWLLDAVASTDLTAVPDGEWSAEALGKHIQGNPLNLEGHQVFLFSLPDWRARITFVDVPHTFAELKEWLAVQKSTIGTDARIEGIVWHHPDGSMVKIKRKDFA